MKVYVVFVNQPIEFGTETSLDCIFSTKEKAESYISTFNGNPRRKTDLKSAYYEDWDVE